MTAARTGWLMWLVIQHRRYGDPWVIASFEAREHADSFAASVSAEDGGHHTVEIDPQYTRLTRLS